MNLRSLTHNEIEVLYAALKAYNIDTDPEWPVMSEATKQQYRDAHFGLESIFESDIMVIVEVDDYQEATT